MTPSDLIGADLVRQIARGVLAMRDFHRGGYALPYPVDAQLALDRIVLACLRNDRDRSAVAERTPKPQGPPVGVPDLMRLCTLPFSEWPIEISESLGGPDAVLVNPRTRQPSRTCVEWAASESGTGSGETTSSVLLRLAMGDHSIWAAYRNFLVEHPVIDLHAGPGFLASPERKRIWQHVQVLYAGVRPELRCPSCGLLAAKEKAGTGWCESESCKPFLPARAAAVREVKALSQETRLSLVLAGRAERRLHTSLTSMGAEVRLVPEPFDHAVITLPSGAAWALVVRVDTQPVLLAEAVRAWDLLPNVDRMVVAVPDAVMRRRADYRGLFGQYSSGSGWTLLSTGRFLTEVKKTVKKVELRA